jgi:hypothetical protein
MSVGLFAQLQWRRTDREIAICTAALCQGLADVVKQAVLAFCGGIGCGVNRSLNCLLFELDRHGARGWCAALAGGGVERVWWAGSGREAVIWGWRMVERRRQDEGWAGKLGHKQHTDDTDTSMGLAPKR